MALDGATHTTILYERIRKDYKPEGDIELLEHFLQDLDVKITENRDAFGKSDDVFSAVQTTVQKILDVVGTLDPLMKIGNIHPVGSFVEGTKLGKPNEFDFVVECSFFTHNPIVSLQNECGNAGTVHIIMSETPLQTTLDHLIIEQSNERGTIKYISPVQFRNRFWQLLTSVASYLSTKDFGIQTETGVLRLVPDIPQHLEMYHKGPNIEIFMLWSSNNEKDKFGISVDVTPAIRLLNSIPETAGVNLARVNRYMEISGRDISDVLLIPTINLECKQGDLSNVFNKLCWRYSFSVLETYIIRAMRSEHKHCLRILKHLKSNPKDGAEEMEELGLGVNMDHITAITIKLHHSIGEMKLLPTYRLKMVVLDHDEKCSHETNMTARCLLEILDLLQQRIVDRFLPIYFLPSKNAWSRSPVSLLESSFEKIISLFKEMMREKDYTFEKFFERFQEVQAYVTERDGD